ncbi:MAG TPA: alcohol dehydrogenase catalytic domain-containing protein, partial [Methylomirabilota bacterium]|nr:alcohol dehydrogenase catalytic domain-containing protein [Methylomirabilota bacterium]
VAPVAATTCDLDRGLIKGRVPYGAPIALGHEFVARVVEVGDQVRGVAPGELVVVPGQISCGDCDRCRAGSTAFCRAVPPNSMYGLGPLVGDWGGGFSDRVRVPFADGMLVRLPRGVAPETVAAAGDNLTNAFEVVVPHLERQPGASVLVAGVGATGLYAVQMARAAGAAWIGYLDHDRARLERARALGATPIEVRRGAPKPTLEREYDVAVDARGEPEDLALLLRSLAPRGICTSVSLYFNDVPLPLLDMFRRGIRLEATRTNVRAHLPGVLSLVESGRLDPAAVTTETRDWEDLPRALVEPSMKPVFVRGA